MAASCRLRPSLVAYQVSGCEGMHSDLFVQVPNGDGTASQCGLRLGLLQGQTDKKIQLKLNRAASAQKARLFT